MTGYPTPKAPLSKECPGFSATSVGTRKVLNAPVKAACEAAEKCTYHDATDRFGSTDSKPSSGRYHRDPVHLNEDGYCKLWSTDLFKKAFKCTSTNKCKGDTAGGSTKPPTKPATTKPAKPTKPLAACSTYKTSAQCDRRRCDYWKVRVA